MENRLLARSRPRADRLATICGSSYSSVIAWPSAIRSGQNATSMSMPRLATSFSAIAVVPGVTVLRRIRICPSRNRPEQSASAVADRVWPPPGVLVEPADHHDDVLGSADDGWVSRGHQPSGGDCPAQRKLGSRLAEWQPPGIDRIDCLIADVVAGHPGARSANATASGRPTRPQPPTITTSHAKRSLRPRPVTKVPPGSALAVTGGNGGPTSARRCRRLLRL